MEAAFDQQLFGDWSALQPAPSDTQLERERKRAELQRIREVFAQAAARGREAQAAKRPSSPAAAPVAAQEQQRRRATSGRPPQPRRPALDTPLAALDECLTPINATTLLGPGLDGRRSTARGGGRARGCQPASGVHVEPAAALTAQGIKLGHPPDSAADFQPKRAATAAAQPPQEPDSGAPAPLPQQHPPHQQQPEQAGQGLGRQGGRQWRAQPQIAKLVQGQKGPGRRSGRGSLGGSWGGSSGGPGSGGRSGGFPFAAPSDEGGLPFTGPAQPKPTRFGSTREALAALMHSARSSGASGAGASGGGGVVGQPRGAQERGRQQVDRELDSPVQDDSPFQLGLPAAGHRARSSRSPDARAGPAAGCPQPPQQRGQVQRERREALPLQPAGRHPPASGTTDAREGSGEVSPGLPTEPLLRTAQSQRQAAQRPQQQQQHPQPQQPQQGADAAAQQGSQAAAQQHLLDEECTLPPPSDPAPIPFGSFTEQPGGGGGRLPAPAPQPPVEQQQAEPAQRLFAQQSVQQQPAPQQRQQEKEEEQAIPDSQEGPHPSSPTVPRRLSPLLAPAAAAAEACALTPPFPPHRPSYQQQPGGAAEQSGAHALPQILQEAQHSGERAQQGGSGAADAGATPMWDSVPPTPAGLLDFSQTAGELGQGHSALNISLTALLERGTLQLDMSPISPAEWAAGGASGTAVGVAAGGASHAAAGGAGAWEDAAARAGAGVWQAEVPALPAQAACAAGSPRAPAFAGSDAPGPNRGEPAAVPLQQQQQQQQSCVWEAEQLPGAPLATTRAPPAPAAAAAAAAERASSAAAHTRLAGSQPRVQPPLVGTQLRLPQPALLAAASPDGRYAAVLLGSFAGYQPLEVLVLQLTDRPGDEAGGPCGRVQPVVSVAVRQCSEHPGWPLNANCLQLATDARGEPVLLLSASLEPEDLPTTLRHAVPVISCAAGKPQLLMEIELPEPAWSLLWLGRWTLLTAGLGGVVQPVSVDFALRRYEWGRPLPVAVYHGFELLDLCRMSVAPGQPQLLAGVSSDGLLAVWDLRSRALLAAHTSHIYRVHHAQLLSWRQFEPGRGGPRSGGSGSGGGGGGPGPPGAAATLAGGPAGGSGAPLSFLAQLRPRDGGGGGGGGGQEAPVLGAVSVTRERLTVGGTLQLPGLTAATVCDGLCLGGTQDGVLHVWDLASGQTQAVDSLDSQTVTCIADVSPQQAAEEEGISPSGSAELGGEKNLRGAAGGEGVDMCAGGSSSRTVLVTGAGGHCLLLDLPALHESWES